MTKLTAAQENALKRLDSRLAAGLRTFGYCLDAKFPTLIKLEKLGLIERMITNEWTLTAAGNDWLADKYYQEEEAQQPAETSEITDNEPDVEAWIAAQERQENERLDAVEWEQETQQFFDENGFLPSDHPLAMTETHWQTIPADHPMHPVFVQAAQRQQQAQADDAEVDSLRAYFAKFPDKRTPEQKLAALNPQSGAQRVTDNYQDFMEDRNIQ